MRIALLALLVGCGEPVADADPEVQIVKVGPTVTDYDCGQPANGGYQKIQVEMPVDVMLSAELCGVATSGDEQVDLCQAALVHRYGEDVVVWCDGSPPVSAETAFIRLWTLAP